MEADLRNVYICLSRILNRVILPVEILESEEVRKMSLCVNKGGIM